MLVKVGVDVPNRPSTIPSAVKQGCQPWTVLSFGRKRLPLRIGKNSGCVAVTSPAGRGVDQVVVGSSPPMHPVSPCPFDLCWTAQAAEKPREEGRPWRIVSRAATRSFARGTSSPSDPASASARRHTAPGTRRRQTRCPTALGPRWRARSRRQAQSQTRRHPFPREGVSLA